MNRLKPKAARVTWGAVGLGRASVIRMAEEVAKVAILNLLETGGIGLVAYLKAKKAMRLVDGADVVAMNASIGQVVARFGGLDVLLNNAHTFASPKPADRVTKRNGIPESGLDQWLLIYPCPVQFC